MNKDSGKWSFITDLHNIQILQTWKAQNVMPYTDIILANATAPPGDCTNKSII